MSHGPQCYNNESQEMSAFLGMNHAITFINEDMEAPYPYHKRALYLEAEINGVLIQRALVDTKSSVDMISFDVLNVTKILKNKIFKSEIHIAGIGNTSEVTLGYMSSYN